MKFEGEHLLPGQFGHIFVLIAFVSSLLSTYSFYKASFEKDVLSKQTWLKYARSIFFIQVAAILAVFFTIYFICSNHYFEYLYAYKHASKELEPKYLLACIWEGQEGSFLLWSIWHCVLGTILIFRAKEWEAPVLSVISLAQCFIMLMLLGLYFGEVRIGFSPFVLTRNELEGPIFSQPNYLSFIVDGVGLNVLLRNYWMVIHPPVLFLGFASAIIPLGFAYAGLSQKKYGEWVKPALPWTLFNGLVLGVGIMMGAKWAYESLSFGGYWAWDPVENASLVPWMISLAGLHCMAVYKATNNSLRGSYFFIICSYAFILYSTFLTRTGILGDTSVHSFTEAGRTVNILIGLFALSFPVPMFILFAKNYKHLPAVHVEESTASREFWMFIGSLVFFLSALFIIAITSVPVFNKVFGKNIADPQDREFAYNKVMVMVAFIIAVISGFAQYFKYRDTANKYFWPKFKWPLIASFIVMATLYFLYPLTYTKQGPGFLIAIYLALFACIYALITNGAYILIVIKGNIKSAGSALAHVGFTLMIAGMLVSSSNKQVISDNRKTGLYIPFAPDPDGKHTEDPLENLTLLKTVPTQMLDYTLTYLKDSAAFEKNRTFFTLLVQQKDTVSGKVKEDFKLTPDVYKMKDNNLSSNPDIKHYLFHDVFTYISSLPDKSAEVDTASFQVNEIGTGDTAFYQKGYVILNTVLRNPTDERFNFSASDTALVADITVVSKDSSLHKSYPQLAVKNLEIVYKDDTVFSQNLIIKLAGITSKGKFKLAIKESKLPSDFVTLKAYVFPFINFVWLGLIIMAAGFVLSILNKVKAGKLIYAVSLLLVTGLLFYMFLIAN